jgi:hypothetical protein
VNCSNINHVLLALQIWLNMSGFIWQFTCCFVIPTSSIGIIFIKIQQNSQYYSIYYNISKLLVTFCNDQTNNNDKSTFQTGTLELSSLELSLSSFSGELFTTLEDKSVRSRLRAATARVLRRAGGLSLLLEELSCPTALPKLGQQHWILLHPSFKIDWMAQPFHQAIPQQ